MAERPRLNLKPRSTEAGAVGGYGASSGKSNPFGAAKPREAVLAARSGESEADIIKKQADEYKGKLNLSRKQREEKEAIEDKIESAKEVLKAEGEGEKAEELKAELEKAENELKELMDGFEKLATETAHKGGDRTLAEKREAEMMGGSIVQGGGRPVDEGYGNFGGRGVGGGGNYGGRGGQGEQYANFGGGDRSGGDYGGNFGGRGGDQAGGDYGGAFGGRGGGQDVRLRVPLVSVRVHPCVCAHARARASERALERVYVCVCDATTLTG